MTRIQEISPIFVKTPLGLAKALFIWHSDTNCWWGCFQDQTGECWWWENRYIRLEKNISEERFNQSPIALPEDMAKALEPHMKRYSK